jgi:thymidylate synthase
MNKNILENKIRNTLSNKNFSLENIQKRFTVTSESPMDTDNIVVVEKKFETAKKNSLSYWEQIKEKFGGKQKTLYQETNNINIVFEKTQDLKDKVQDTMKQNTVVNAFRIFTNKPISDMEESPDTPLNQCKDQPRKLSDVCKVNEIPKRKSIMEKMKEIAQSRTDKSSSALKLKEMCEAAAAAEPVDVIPAALSLVLPKDNNETPIKYSPNNKAKFSFITIADKKDNPVVETIPNEIKKSNVPNEPTKVDPAPHEETQYTNLIREIINTGYDECGRNGDTITKFGYSMRFSLRDGTIPILTTKKLAWRVCFEELFWFIRGATNNKELQEKNVHIWDQNSSREFLDSRGLYYLEEGDLGPIYGFQWRHFNAEYADSTKCYQGEGIDQLEQIIETLKNPETRTSRRMIMTAWNPCQLNYMALPPCHILAQFHVRENKYLSCALYQRSGDVGLGVPFNIASYSLLTHILAKHCGLEADEFIHFLGNCHIYKEHIMPLKQQIKLEPMAFPKIEITTVHESIDDYSLEDISWTKPYESHPAIKMIMKA